MSQQQNKMVLNMSYDQGYDGVLDKLAELADQGHNFAEICEASINGLGSLDFTKTASVAEQEWLTGEQAALAAFIKEASVLIAHYEFDDEEAHLVTYDMLNKIAEEKVKPGLFRRGADVLDTINDGKKLNYTDGGARVKQQGKQLWDSAKDLGMAGAQLGRRALMGGENAGAVRKYVPSAALAAGAGYGAYRLKKRYDERKKKRASYGDQEVEAALDILYSRGLIE